MKNNRILTGLVAFISMLCFCLAPLAAQTTQSKGSTMNGAPADLKVHNDTSTALGTANLLVPVYTNDTTVAPNTIANIEWADITAKTALPALLIKHDVTVKDGVGMTNATNAVITVNIIGTTATATGKNSLDTFALDNGYKLLDDDAQAALTNRFRTALNEHFATKSFGAGGILRVTFVTRSANTTGKLTTAGTHGITHAVAPATTGG